MKRVPYTVRALVYAAFAVIMLAAPSVMADPSASPPCPIPAGLHSFRITDVDQTGPARFRYEFEILNWTGTENHDLFLALASGTPAVVNGPPFIASASVDGNGRPLGGGNDDANFPPADGTGMPAKIGVFNTWGVAFQDATSVRWAEPTGLPGFGVPPRDIFGACPAACGIIPGCLDVPPPTLLPSCEATDNGLGPDNVMDGLIIEIDDFDQGEYISLNWFLTDSIGAPIGVSGLGNAYGFGTFNLFRKNADCPVGPAVWKRTAASPAGPGQNSGATSSFCDRFPSGPVADEFQVEFGEALTAPFANPANNIFGAPIDAEIINTRDHYKCYKTKRIAHNPPPIVLLEDQFATTVAEVQKVHRLCNPVDKNGEGINDVTAHLNCHKIREGKTDRVDVVMTNQFGSQQLTVMRAETLCAPAEKNLVSTNADRHFKCYKVRRTKDAPKFTPFQVGLLDQFEDTVATVRRPHLVCTPVNKNDEEPEAVCDPDHLTCFRIKGAPKHVPVTVHVADQFGSNDQTTSFRNNISAKRLCVPSTKYIPTTEP